MKRSWASWNEFGDNDGNPRGLDLAWRALEAGFRRRIEREELFLQGIEITADMSGEPKPIRGAFVSKFSFDFKNNNITYMKRQFVSVKVSQAQFPEPLSKPPMPVMREILSGDVGSLDDETILALLEEHARRVIASPDAKLVAPGKISLMPIVLGKMRQRAQHDELLPQMKVEALWLAKWIQSKVTLHQTPSYGTIAKVLGAEYRLLNARSKAAI